MFGKQMFVLSYRWVTQIKIIVADKAYKPYSGKTLQVSFLYVAHRGAEVSLEPKRF